MEVVAEGDAAQTCFQKEYGEQSFKHLAFRKECYDIGKRTCEIVSVYSHKFTAKLTGEGIQQALIPVYEFAKRLVKIYVLSVEIKNKHGCFAERMYSERDVYEIHNRNGDSEAEPKISLIAEKELFEKRAYFTARA